MDLGALAQVSVAALFDRSDRNFALACLEHHLAHIIATDAHHMVEREPCMELLNRLPAEILELQEACSEAVWNNEMVPYMRAATIKKTFFGYR